MLALLLSLKESEINPALPYFPMPPTGLSAAFFSFLLPSSHATSAAVLEIASTPDGQRQVDLGTITPLTQSETGHQHHVSAHPEHQEQQQQQPEGEGSDSAAAFVDSDGVKQVYAGKFPSGGREGESAVLAVEGVVGIMREST